MGKKSTPAPPPLPPDYTNQREAAVSAENAQREATAGAFNERVGFFNDQLSGFGNNIDALGDTVRGLDLSSDFSNFDDLTGQIDEYRDQAQGFLDGDFSSFQPFAAPEPAAAENTGPAFDFNSSNFNFSGGNDFSFGGSFGTPASPAPAASANLQYDQFGFPTTPNFQSTGTAFGESVFYDTPTLSSLDTDRANRFLTELNQIEGTLTGLVGERDRELDRGSSFFGNFSTLADEGNFEVGRADLNTDFDDYLADIERARRELNSFNSVLDFGDQRTSTLTELDAFEELVRSRIGEQTTEQDRISTFRQDLGGRASSLRDQLRGFGIADITNSDDILAQIDALNDEARTFDSELDFNFNAETGILSDAQFQLQSLEQQRAIEEGRLNTASRQYETQAQRLAREAGRVDFTDGQSLNALQDEFDFLQDSIGAENSELDFDFSSILDTLGGGRETLDSLFGQRTEALNAELGDVEGILSGLDDIEEYDEGSLRDIQTRLQREADDLQRYGGGTTENTRAIDDGLRAVTERLDTLNSSRRGIESEALSLLQGARGNFANLDEVNGSRETFEALRNRAETFGAGQANDELAIIEQLLGTASDRITTDNNNVAQSEGRDAALTRALLDGNNNLQFARVNGREIDSIEQLRSYLALAGSEEDDILNINDQSAFARQFLGV